MPVKLGVAGRAMFLVALLVASSCSSDDATPGSTAASPARPTTHSDIDDTPAPGATESSIVVVTEEAYERAVADTAACVRQELPGAHVITTKLPTGYYQLEIEDFGGSAEIGDPIGTDTAYFHCRSLHLEAVESTYLADTSIYLSPEEYLLEQIEGCLIEVGVDPPPFETIADAVGAAAGTPCAAH